MVAFQKTDQQADLLFHFASANDPCLQVNFLGQALALSDDYILANWSDRGQLDIVDKTGELLWRLRAPLGAAFGFADHRQYFPYQTAQ